MLLLRRASYLWLYFFAGLSLVLSCTKDKDTDEGPQENVLTKAEVEKNIVGKWDISGLSQLSSFEFTAYGTFAVSGNLNLIALRPAGSDDIVLKSTASAPEYFAGEYKISEDGKTIVLNETFTISIEKLTSEKFDFKITLPGTDGPLSVNGSAAAASGSTEKTAALANGWGYQGTNAEDKLQLHFTKFGTLFIRIWVIEQDQSSEGGPVNTKKYWETIRADWEWKDQTEQSVRVYLVDGETSNLISVEWPVHNITADKLELSIAFGETGARRISFSRL